LSVVCGLFLVGVCPMINRSYSKRKSNPHTFFSSVALIEMVNFLISKFCPVAHYHPVVLNSSSPHPHLILISPSPQRHLVFASARLWSVKLGLKGHVMVWDTTPPRQSCLCTLNIKCLEACGVTKLARRHIVSVSETTQAGRCRRMAGDVCVHVHDDLRDISDWPRIRHQIKVLVS